MHRHPQRHCPLQRRPHRQLRRCCFRSRRARSRLRWGRRCFPYGEAAAQSARRRHPAQSFRECLRADEGCWSAPGRPGARWRGVVDQSGRSGQGDGSPSELPAETESACRRTRSPSRACGRADSSPWAGRWAKGCWRTRRDRASQSSGTRGHRLPRGHRAATGCRRGTCYPTRHSVASARRSEGSETVQSRCSEQTGPSS